MIPVAADHAADVINGDQFPGFIANVLPAGNFFQHQKAVFVAGIEKMAGLRIVRGADDIAIEVAAQNVARRGAARGPAWPVRQRETSDGGQGRAA